MEIAIVGMEPTGHYWLNLAHILKENQIKFVAVNPLHVKRGKELDDNSPTKNDVKDAKVIAQLVKDGRYAEPTTPQGVYAELRVAKKIRNLLFRVCMIMVAKNSAFKALHAYYTQCPDNPLKKMQSLIALSNKLIRIFFAIGKKQFEFSEELMYRISLI
jgi:hypothetical protein